MRKSQLDEQAPPKPRGRTREAVGTTVERIKDEIRSLKPIERIELYKWLDDDVATDLCLRIGAERSIEIRRTSGSRVILSTR